MSQSVYTSRTVKDSFLTSIRDNFIILVYDLETTGLDEHKNHIIQLSVRKCIVLDHGLEEIEAKAWWINPGYALPDKITQLTGITDDFLADKPFEAEVIEEIIQYFDDYAVLGYNNIKFDDRFMEVLFKRYGGIFRPWESIDLYLVVKNVIEPGVTENQKLVTITRYFGYADRIEQFHNAEWDTLATLLCCNRLIGLCRQSLAGPNDRLIKCKVQSITRWENKYQKRDKRIYITTDRITFFFDLYHQTWNTEKTEQIAQYDLEEVIRQVLELANVSDEKELSKFRGHLVA